MVKGSQFERWVGQKLSLWWTDGLRDDVFWRSTASGARATLRSKKGQRTSNSCGDITTIDPGGQPLLDLVVIELKRGYNAFSVADLLDQPARAKEQLWEQWFRRADEVGRTAGTLGWWLISRRDRRLPLLFLPKALLKALLPAASYDAVLRPCLTLCYGNSAVVGAPLDCFLRQVTPDRVRQAVAGKGERGSS